MTFYRHDDILALEGDECQQSREVSAKMSISDRKKKILAAVVDEYIRTAEPVGSKHIAENAGLGCSSATIRNELAELVALGYLEQPHTSAGRVPTPLGYRLYVNELMEQQKLSLEELAGNKVYIHRGENNLIVEISQCNGGNGIPFETGLIFATLSHESQAIMTGVVGLVSYIHDTLADR